MPHSRRETGGHKVSESDVVGDGLPYTQLFDRASPRPSMLHPSMPHVHEMLLRGNWMRTGTTLVCHRAILCRVARQKQHTFGTAAASAA